MPGGNAHHSPECPDLAGGECGAGARHQVADPGLGRLRGLEIYAGRGVLPGAGSLLHASDLGQRDVGEVLEGANPSFHVGQSDMVETADAELLYCIRAHGRAVHHRTAQVVFCDRSGPSQVGHEPTGEGVAGAGGVEDRLQREGWHIEGAARLDQKRSMLALLDDHPLGTVGQDPAPRPVDVPVATQLTGFTVVHHEHIHPAQQPE